MEANEVRSQHLQLVFVLTLLHNPLKIRYLIELVTENPFQMWLKDFAIQLDPLSTEPRNSVIRGTSTTRQSTVHRCRPHRTIS